jgi:paraquat-inducible protein B
MDDESLKKFKTIVADLFSDSSDSIDSIDEMVVDLYNRVLEWHDEMKKSSDEHIIKNLRDSCNKKITELNQKMRAIKSMTNSIQQLLDPPQQINNYIENTNLSMEQIARF